MIMSVVIFVIVLQPVISISIVTGKISGAHIVRVIIIQSRTDT